MTKYEEVMNKVGLQTHIEELHSKSCSLDFIAEALLGFRTEMGNNFSPEALAGLGELMWAMKADIKKVYDAYFEHMQN